MAGQPFDQRFHLVLNVAVGGNFLSGPDPDTVWQYPDAQMKVDYVKVFSLPVSTTIGFSCRHLRIGTGCPKSIRFFTYLLLLYSYLRIVLKFSRPFEEIGFECNVQVFKTTAKFVETVCINDHCQNTQKYYGYIGILTYRIYAYYVKNKPIQPLQL